MRFMDSLKAKAGEAKNTIASKVEEVATSEETKEMFEKAKKFVSDSIENAKIDMKRPSNGYLVFDENGKFADKYDDGSYSIEEKLLNKATEAVKLSKGYACVYKSDKLIATIRYEEIIQTEIVGDYEIGKAPNETEYAIYRYVGFDKDIVIPSAIDDKKITKIADKAFYENASITSVKISEGIECLGDSCFACCDKLTSVTLPDTLKKIKHDAFENCGITEIILPDSVIEFGYGCFEKCDDLKYAKLPKNLETIPPHIFENCSMLEKVELPENVVNIEESAFAGCSIKINEIPSTVKCIEKYAFQFCTNFIDELRLPNGIESIGDSALNHFHVKKLYIPSSVKFIGEKIIDDFIDEVYIEDGCAIGEHGGFCGELDLWVTDKYYLPKSITKEITMHPQSYVGLEIDGTGKLVMAQDHNQQVMAVWNEIEEKTKNLIIYCEPGSAVQEYAQKKKIKMQKWNPNNIDEMPDWIKKAKEKE